MSRVQGDDDRERFAAALGRLVGTRSAWLAGEVGVSEQAVRDWISGKAVPSPYRVFEVEKILELEPGELSAHLGYVPADSLPGVLQALAVDPAVSEDMRGVLRTIYVDHVGRRRRRNRR